MIQCISFSGIEYISKHISQNRYTVWGKRLSENCFQLCNSATVIHVSMVSLQNFTFNHAFNFSGVLKLLTASPHTQPLLLSVGDFDVQSVDFLFQLDFLQKQEFLFLQELLQIFKR